MSLIVSMVAHAVIGAQVESSQTPPPKPPVAGAPQAAQPAAPKVETYESMTKDYTRHSGVFEVFRKDDSLLFQLPNSAIGRDFLWVTEVKQAPSGAFPGVPVAQGVVRFEARGDKILVRMNGFGNRASTGDEIRRAVADSNVMPIAAVLDAKVKSKEGDPLLDVSRFFKGELADLSTRGAVGGSMDLSRTFVNKVRAFPQNVNVEVEATFAGSPGVPGGGGRFGGTPSRPSNTVMLHHSILMLPEKPMMGRLDDSRVGFFSYGFADYGTDEHGAKQLAYISRYRLEKKDPDATLSEPKKQIVYYIGREVPKKWWPYVKAGVEEWKSAFEAAGFKDAIVCKPAPTEQDDPDWSPEDLRNSVIRWAPLPIANAMGPHYADPRSGEILSAHVIMWHDILKLQTDWYFAQASAVDRRAQRLPLPDDLMGECVQFVVAHEVGHTLGLPHNGKASSTTTIRQLRDPRWTRENGTCPSIMDYARFNYVAQPGDDVNMIPKVGKYDKFSIAWGYKPIPYAHTPEDEKPVLDAWASRQVQDPQLRFYDNFSPVDPTAQAEALGDDAVLASSLGTANLKRTMGFLESATSRFGSDYSDLDRQYNNLWGQFSRYVGHVSVVVGGVVQTDYHAGRGGLVYQPSNREYQKRAVQWLVENTLETPSWLVPQSVVMKLGPGGSTSRVSNLQFLVLARLLSFSRIDRMVENEAVNGAQAFPVAEMTEMVRGQVWRDLAPGVKLDAYRRSLQRNYVTILVNLLGSGNAESRSLAIGELKTSLSLVKRGSVQAGDAASRAHFDDLTQSITLGLTFPAQSSVASALGRIFGANANLPCQIATGRPADFSLNEED